MGPAYEVGKCIDSKIANALLGEHLGAYSKIYEITPTVSDLLCTDNDKHQVHRHLS